MTKGRDCFPQEAGRFIPVVTERPADGSAAKAAQGAATIYVDRSGSMIGYLNGAVARIDSPFQDAIEALPTMLGEIGVKATYKAFATDSVDVGSNPVATLQSPAFYRCAGCGTSRLDKVVASIAADPAQMAVIITDLWPFNPDTRSSGHTQLAPYLLDILANGRAISIYGVEARFDGGIYDIPVEGPEPRIKVDHKGRHPFYMIVVGSKAQAIGFESAIRTSHALSLYEALKAGRIQRSIFTVDPGPLEPRDETPVEPGNDRRMRNAAFEPVPGVPIQQFTLTSDAQRGPGKAIAPSWTGPSDDAFIDKAVWAGPLQPRLRYWQRENARCEKNSWSPPVAIDNAAWSEMADGKRKLIFDPVDLSARLGRNGVYLVSGDLERRSVTAENDATAWMRDPRWSVSAAAAGALAARRPPTYPTLNLAELARILEDALAKAAERNRGGALVGFSILVRRVD